MKTLLLALALVPLASDAATIYSCQRAKGEVFWSASPCSRHKAIRKGIFSVPDGLTFEQQVQHARQHAMRAECKGDGKRKQARDRQEARCR